MKIISIFPIVTLVVTMFLVVGCASQKPEVKEVKPPVKEVVK